MNVDSSVLISCDGKSIMDKVVPSDLRTSIRVVGLFNTNGVEVLVLTSQLTKVLFCSSNAAIIGEGKYTYFS